MRNFKTEDFNGAGQYLIRMSPQEIYAKENNEHFRGYTDAGYLSTIMYKVGWLTNNYDIGNGQQIYALIAMSDGMIQISNYKEVNPSNSNNWDKNIWQSDNIEDIDGGKRKMVDWLNNPELSCEYRFATQEEVVRVVLNQSSRWR